MRRVALALALLLAPATATADVTLRVTTTADGDPRVITLHAEKLPDLDACNAARAAYEYQLTARHGYERVAAGSLRTPFGRGATGYHRVALTCSSLVEAADAATPSLPNLEEEMRRAAPPAR
jgi:hypothetical protein